MLKNIIIPETELCAWCGDEIYFEVESSLTKEKYCRTQCMVSHIRVEQSFNKIKEDEEYFSHKHQQII